MKRITVCFLIFSLCLCFLAACTENGTETANSSEVSVLPSPSAEESSTDTAYDLQGRTFKVIQRWFGYQNPNIDFTGEVIWADTEDGTFTEIDLAKKQVLEKTQKELNCTVSGEILTKTPAEVRTLIEEDLLSGAPTIDFCFETFYYYSDFVVNGYLADLGSLGVDLSAPWWDAGAVRDLSLGNKHYYGIGDINTYDNDGTFAVLFNKKLYAEKYGDVSSLYSLAAEGGFTFDFLREKVTDFGHDNTYGLLTDASNLYLHLISAGERIVGKDEEDGLAFTLNADRGAKVYSDAAELYVNAKDVLLYNDSLIGITPRPDNTLEAFTEGRGLFYITTVSKISRLGDMEDEYGILPLPKYDSAQASYCTTVGNFSTSCVFVPRTRLSEGDKGKEIGILLDTIGKHSREILTPAYLNKVSPDEGSKEMLGIILSSRIYDMGEVYSLALNNPVVYFTTLGKSFTEQLNICKPLIEKAVADFNENITK